jgi:hypothetical protein
VPDCCTWRRPFYLKGADALVDFVIEAMRPELADYSLRTWAPCAPETHFARFDAMLPGAGDTANVRRESAIGS